MGDALAVAAPRSPDLDRLYEPLDELVALLVVGELLEGVALFIGDDPAHVLVEPLLIDLAQLGLKGFVVPLLLFIIFLP